MSGNATLGMILLKEAMVVSKVFNGAETLNC